MRQRIASIHWAIGLVFATAILLRLLVFASIVHEPRKFYTYDSDGYDRRAVTLLRYGVFSSQPEPPFTPDLRRTPIYPGILAVVFALAGHRPDAAILLQVLLGGLTAVLTFLLARELQLPPVAGVIGAFIVAVDPVSVLTANHLLTETLFAALLAAGVWSLARFWRTARVRWVLLSAALLALTALTRPIGQFLPLALLPLFALAARRGRLRAALGVGLLFVAVSMALTYSWAYRNYRQGGMFTLSTIGDTNLTYYRARAVLAAAEGTDQEAAWSQLEARINRTVAEQHLTPAQTIALQRQEALAIFRKYPGLTLVMLAKGVVRMFADPGYTYTCTLLDPNTTAWDCFPGTATMNEPGLLDKALGKFGQLSLIQQATLLWSIVLLGLTYLGGMVGALRLARERRWVALALLLVVIGYFVAVSAGAETDSRFRMPIVPFLALLTGAGIGPLIARYAVAQTLRVAGGDSFGMRDSFLPPAEGFRSGRR